MALVEKYITFSGLRAVERAGGQEYTGISSYYYGKGKVAEGEWLTRREVWVYVSPYIWMETFAMLDINQLLQDHEARISAIEKRLQAVGVSAQVQIPKKQSAKEFLLSKKINADTQKVVALAYFLEKQEGLDSFNVPDLETAFRAAREKLPKNMNDAVNKNVARGFLMEAEQKKDSKKAWQLTSTGERFVEQDMERGT